LHTQGGADIRSAGSAARAADDLVSVAFAQGDGYSGSVGESLSALGNDRQFVRRRAPASPTGGVVNGILNLGCHFTPSLRNSVFRSARASRGPRFKARQAQNQQPARSTKSAANQPQNPEPRQDLLWFPKIAGSAKSQTWRRNMPFALFGGRGACGS